MSTQTFRHSFRTHSDCIITRRHMAGALRYLASQLEMPEQPDGSPQELQGDNDFEIEGFCRDNSGVITIVQKLRTPR